MYMPEKTLDERIKEGLEKLAKEPKPDWSATLQEIHGGDTCPVTEQPYTAIITILGGNRYEQCSECGKDLDFVDIKYNLT